MPRNPFRKPTPYERAREELREQLEKAEQTLADVAEPLPKPARRPIMIAAVGGAAALALVLLRRAGSTGTRPDIPEPGPVQPTAPLGPDSERLNDPALKAKVESELFALDEAPKDRIDVGVADGVVTLRGTLDSRDQTTTITAAAERIDGVRRVENLMTS